MEPDTLPPDRRPGEDQEVRSNTVRDKRLRLNQNKLDRLKAVMGAASATEAIEQAMDFILAEDEIHKTLRRVGAKGRFKMSS